MKKLLLIAFATIVALSTISCTGESNQEEQQDVQTDTIEQPVIQEVTGLAVDGAMNSVYLKIGDDTVEFSYPDLDGDHRDSWVINDTLTVRYYETADGDSVIDVINNANA
jgi:hypothetical protein